MASRIVALGCCLAMAGCANTAAMRDLATQTSNTVAAHQASLDNFVAAQKALNAADAEELSLYARAAADERAQTDLLIGGWHFAGDQELLANQAFAAQVGPSTITISLAATQPPPQPIDDGGASAKLATAKTQFAHLAKPPSTVDGLKEIYASASAVYDALETLKSSAAKSAGDAASKASTGSAPSAK